MFPVVCSYRISRVVAASITSDNKNNNVSSLAEDSFPFSSQSLTLVIVYIVMTLAGFFIVLFSLLQLDVIFSRRPAFSVQSLVQFLTCCCQRRSVRSIWNADKIKQQTRRLSVWTPLIVHVGVVDAFINCEFTEVRARIFFYSFNHRYCS